MAITIVKGSKEYIKVEVIDNRDVPITDLSGLSPLYDTTEDDGTTAVQTGATPTVSGMFLYCLIDGTLSGYVVSEKYHLYPKFTTSPEIPKLGPIEFFITT